MKVVNKVLLFVSCLIFLMSLSLLPLDDAVAVGIKEEGVKQKAQSEESQADAGKKKAEREQSEANAAKKEGKLEGGPSTSGPDEKEGKLEKGEKGKEGKEGKKDKKDGGNAAKGSGDPLKGLHLPKPPVKK